MHCDPAKPDDHIVFANLLVHVNSTTICRVKEKKKKPLSSALQIRIKAEWFVEYCTVRRGKNSVVDHGTLSRTTPDRKQQKQTTQYPQKSILTLLNELNLKYHNLQPSATQSTEQRSRAGPSRWSTSVASYKWVHQPSTLFGQWLASIISDEQEVHGWSWALCGAYLA